MYVVTLYNGDIKTVIHGNGQHLTSGSVVKGINTIDSFTFTILPSNDGFNAINDFTTLVSVYNSKKSRYEFWGRALYPQESMEESGLIAKEVTCESFLAFLIDSKQPYVEEQNWTVTGLLQRLIDQHNSMVEEYKQFTIGEVTVTDPNDNLYCGIQRESTWDAINNKLIKVLGGEIRFRVEDGVTYLDYLTEIGETRATPIALSRNMRAITRERNPSEYVTRLIPLGCKLTKEIETTDDEGNVSTETVETEERLDITSVNDGLNYVEDDQARERYGIIYAYVEYDDVTEASNLLAKGRKWLEENNRIQVKYSITAVDLSLLGLDIDDFEVYDRYPIRNALLGIDDTARIIKRTIDICDISSTSIEIGDNFKTLSDIQVEQAGKIETTTNTVSKIESDYITNQILANFQNSISSLIKQTADNITLNVSETYVNIEDNDLYKQEIEAQLQLLADELLLKFTQTTESIISVDGDMQTRFEEIYQYIKFVEGNIVLGRSDSQITLTIENDMVAFRKNGVVFGSWDGEMFYTGDIKIRLNERLQLGNFAFIPRSNGGLSFLKVGD